MKYASPKQKDFFLWKLALTSFFVFVEEVFPQLQKYFIETNSEEDKVTTDVSPTADTLSISERKENGENEDNESVPGVTIEQKDVKQLKPNIQTAVSRIIDCICVSIKSQK